MRAQGIRAGAAALGVGVALVASACTPASYYQGSYYHHGIGVTVDAAGKATVSYRTYTWCGPGVPQPCDSVVGNTLYSGGRATFRLTSAPAAHVGVGVTTGGNQIRSGQRVTLTTLRTKGGKPSVIRIAGLGLLGTQTYCGADHVPDCGA